MIREHSDNEDSVMDSGTDWFVDATAETEVELRPDTQGYPHLPGSGLPGRRRS